MLDLPFYVPLTLVVCVLFVLFMLHRATGSKTALGISLTWIVLQGALSFSGFYTVTDTLPPRFLLLVLPPLVMILALFSSKAGRNFLSSTDKTALTWLHSVRIPVEIMLFWLFIGGYIPKLMTFEGANFDIAAGLTAPLIVWFGYKKDILPKSVKLLWNLICLGLLLNIVIHAVLSAPFAFQQFAFDQPNIGVLYFPFTLLPGFIVPVVMFSHLVNIRDLLTSQN